ncbi:MAG: tetratricopeptide repeat protein, partial [Anaerolineae bacterium]|nr:tetratricopeptide repeat protein [Anaerolineae bacterium]
ALDICTATGNPFLILYTNLLLAITHTQSGRVKQADDICRQLARQVNEGGMGHTAVAGWIASIWGEVLAELDELDAAVRHAQKGLELTERGGDVMMLGWSYLSLVRVLFSSGDLPAAEALVQQARSLGQGSELPGWVQSQLAAWQARVWLALGHRKAASEWVDERGLAAGQEPLAYAREAEYITLARILTAQGPADEATNLLDRLLEAAEADGRTSRAIEILNLQSLAFQAGGSMAQAKRTLGRALALAEPGGFVRIFVDEGSPMARLLYEAAARGISPEYTAELLAAFPVGEPEPSDPSRPQT